MGCGASVNISDSLKIKGSEGSKGLSKKLKKAAELAIPDDYKDPVFKNHSVFLWGQICSFLPCESILSLALLNTGFNTCLIYRTFSRVKLTNELQREDAQKYMHFVRMNFTNLEEIDTHGFKYKKLANFLVFKMKSLKKINGRMNTALLVKILPQTANVTHVETGLKGMTQYAELIKFEHLTHLTLLEIDESTPVQKILMECPNLTFLELCTGWARNYPTLTHHKLEVVKARNTEEGSHHVEFKSKMANHLDDYLPNLKELYNVSGNNIIASESLEVFDCSYFRQLEETVNKCPKLRKIVAYSASLEPENCEPDNVEEVDFNKVKISNLPLFFEKTQNLIKASLRNFRLEQYPFDDKKETLVSPLLKELHLEVEHSFPPEDLHLLIKGFPKLHTFSLRYIPKKKLTYDKVIRVMEVKKIVLEHVENSSLGRFTIIEGYHKDYPIYYEFAMKDTFEKCKALKTIVLVTLPTKKRQGPVKHYFDRFQYEEKELVWLCDRKIFEERPERKLRKAARSKNKAKEAELERKKQEDKTMEEKMNTMEENKDQIEDSQILAKAEAILLKKESDINEFDEELLEQADEIMRKRKNAMQKIHMRMKKKRERARSVVHLNSKNVANNRRLGKTSSTHSLLEKSKDDHDQDDAKLRLRSKFNARKKWGEFKVDVMKNENPEKPIIEKEELDMSLFTMDVNQGNSEIDDFNLTCETALAHVESVDFSLRSQESTPNPSMENVNLFEDILGELSGNAKNNDEKEKCKIEPKEPSSVSIRDEENDLSDKNPENDGMKKFEEDLIPGRETVPKVSVVEKGEIHEDKPRIGCSLADTLQEKDDDIDDILGGEGEGGLFNFPEPENEIVLSHGEKEVMFENLQKEEVGQIPKLKIDQDQDVSTSNIDGGSTEEEQRVSSSKFGDIEMIDSKEEIPLEGDVSTQSEKCSDLKKLDENLEEPSINEKLSQKLDVLNEKSETKVPDVSERPVLTISEDMTDEVAEGDAVRWDFGDLDNLEGSFDELDLFS